MHDRPAALPRFVSRRAAPALARVGARALGLIAAMLPGCALTHATRASADASWSDRATDAAPPPHIDAPPVFEPDAVATGDEPPAPRDVPDARDADARPTDDAPPPDAASCDTTVDQDCDGLPDFYDPCPLDANHRIGGWSAADVLRTGGAWTQSGGWSLVTLGGGAMGAEYMGAMNASLLGYTPPAGVATAGVVVLSVWEQLSAPAMNASVSTYARAGGGGLLACGAVLAAGGPDVLLALRFAGGAIMGLGNADLTPALTGGNRFVLGTAYRPAGVSSGAYAVSCRAQNGPAAAPLVASGTDTGGTGLGVASTTRSNAALVAVAAWEDVACAR